MVDNQLHTMLRRLFQHTQSMRKYQINVRSMNSAYDKSRARKLEQQVDLDISNINSYVREAMSPPATSSI